MCLTPLEQPTKVQGAQLRPATYSRKGKHPAPSSAHVSDYCPDTQIPQAPVCRICISWNRGQCTLPGTCSYTHVCLTCNSRSHRACDCAMTPPDSVYKKRPTQHLPRGDGATAAANQMVHQQGFRHSLHYLDNFLFLGAPASPHCEDALHFTLKMSREGVQVCNEKTEGPSTSITFLGIEIDSVHQQLQLPQAKLRDLHEHLNHWMLRHHTSRSRRPHHTGTKHNLLSLIGVLNHAAGYSKRPSTYESTALAVLSTVLHRKRSKNTFFNIYFVVVHGSGTSFISSNIRE